MQLGDLNQGHQPLTSPHRVGLVGGGRRKDTQERHDGTCIRVLLRSSASFSPTSCKCSAAESVVFIMQVSAQLCVFGRVSVFQVCLAGVSHLVSRIQI